MKTYPLLLLPVTKKIIWGGTYLSENYNIGENGESIAEAWMMTSRPDGTNLIGNGDYKGMSVSEYIEMCSVDEVCGSFDAFPLLIKLIDANDRLSVQVHPDDVYAKNNKLDAGKTEMWYVVDAKPGAKLVCGIKDKTAPTYEEILSYNENGTLSEHLNYVDVSKGDCFFIPAGLVHAIGAGIVVAEIQQNSNTTFRLYDYDRVGKDGKKRELHIKQASEVIKTEFDVKATVNTVTQNADGCKITILCDCNLFSAEKYNLKSGSSFSFCRDAMQNLLCLDGNGYISYLGEKYEVKKGSSYLIPKNIKNYSVCSADDSFEIIISSPKNTN